MTEERTKGNVGKRRFTPVRKLSFEIQFHAGSECPTGGRNDVAQACLLLLHRQTDYYPEMHSILVYPSTYFVTEMRHVGAGVLEEGHYPRLGEAWQHGAVVLAWDAVCQGTADPDDGTTLFFTSLLTRSSNVIIYRTQRHGVPLLRGHCRNTEPYHGLDMPSQRL